ncbi:collagen alpha-1(II) chain-like [Cynocephalus volans]|uniref:collagen alpha-1(II) chain-like n=1 Tax=Cynocephalus volans TaxID=110931 RepID=UPI002FC852EA
MPPKWLQDATASATPEDSIPSPPPPRGGNLKAQNQATVSWGLGGPVRNIRNGSPESPGGQATVQGRAQRPAEAGVRPGPQRRGPGEGTPPGLPTVSLRAHTPRTRTPARTAPPRRPGGAPSRHPPQRRHPRPGPPRAAARKTLHSPEFLHVCGRGLRETKREGQQAGGRPAAAPGGAGPRGHRRARRRGAPAGLRLREARPRAPLAPTPSSGRRDSVGAPGRGRVTGEPARAAALPGTELHPPGRAGGRPGDAGWHGPGGRGDTGLSPVTLGRPRPPPLPTPRPLTPPAPRSLPGGAEPRHRRSSESGHVRAAESGAAQADTHTSRGRRRVGPRASQSGTPLPSGSGVPGLASPSRARGINPCAPGSPAGLPAGLAQTRRRAAWRPSLPSPRSRAAPSRTGRGDPPATVNPVGAGERQGPRAARAGSHFLRGAGGAGRALQRPGEAAPGGFPRLSVP